MHLINSTQRGDDPRYLLAASTAKHFSARCPPGSLVSLLRLFPGTRLMFPQCRGVYMRNLRYDICYDSDSGSLEQMYDMEGYIPRTDPQPPPASGSCMTPVRFIRPVSLWDQVRYV